MIKDGYQSIEEALFASQIFSVFPIVGIILGFIGFVDNKGIANSLSTVSAQFQEAKLQLVFRGPKCHCLFLSWVVKHKRLSKAAPPERDVFCIDCSHIPDSGRRVFQMLQNRPMTIPVLCQRSVLEENSTPMLFSKPYEVTSSDLLPGVHQGHGKETLRKLKLTKIPSHSIAMLPWATSNIGD